MYRAFLLFSMHHVQSFSLTNSTTPHYYILSADVSVTVKSIKYCIITLVSGVIAFILMLYHFFCFSSIQLRHLGSCYQNVDWMVVVLLWTYLLRSFIIVTEMVLKVVEIWVLYFAVRTAAILTNILNINTLMFEPWFIQGLVFQLLHYSLLYVNLTRRLPWILWMLFCCFIRQPFAMWYHWSNCMPLI